jgi:predicted nucleic acid-binding protein
MRVVLDSTVVAAAFASRGICEALFAHCLESHDVFMCATQMARVSEQLVARAGVPKDTGQDIVSYLDSTLWPTSPAEVDPETCRDPNHREALGVARAAQAHYIVTCDPTLLALKKYRGTEIVDPRSFWSIAKGAPPQWRLR